MSSGASARNVWSTVHGLRSTVSARHNMTGLRDYLDFAVAVAWQAGRLTLAHYQTGVTVEQKPDASVVTVADREAERLIRQRIASRFPDHSIVGEEFGANDRPGS